MHVFEFSNITISLSSSAVTVLKYCNYSQSVSLEHRLATSSYKVWQGLRTRQNEGVAGSSLRFSCRNFSRQWTRQNTPNGMELLESFPLFY